MLTDVKGDIDVALSVEVSIIDGVLEVRQIECQAILIMMCLIG